MLSAKIDQPMRVVHVVRQFHPAIGGLETGVMNLVQCQRNQCGLDASVVALDRIFTRPKEMLPRQEVISGVPVRRIGWTGSRRYPLAPGVLSCIREADLVHVHGIDFFFDFLAWTRPVHSKPLIATTHGGFFHTPFLSPLKTAWFHSLTRASLLAYAAVIACSESDARRFAAIAGNRLVMIENGVDIDKFAGSASPQPRRCLIYFGRLAAHKRIGLVFALLAALRRRNPDWRLIVAGSPGDLDWPALQAEAQHSAVTDAVSWMDAPDNIALRQAMHGSSYFACASAYEGFGLAAIEALSAGLLPVLSDIPPFRKLLHKLDCGVMLDAEDLERTAADLEQLHSRLAADPQPLRQNCITTARAYDWSSISQHYMALYRRAVAVPDVYA